MGDDVEGGPGAAPTGRPPGDWQFDEYLEAVWRIARSGGLSHEEASDVCLVTLLRLRDGERSAARSPRATGEWMVRTAIEQCRVAWQLSSWRPPHLVSVQRPSGATQ